MSFLPFNVADYEPLEEFKPLPVGYYTAIIVDSEIKDTKSGTGQYLALTFEVVEGEHTSRKVFHNINIVNANSEAERIGRQELATLTQKLGVGNVQDTTDLHNKPVKIYLTIEEYNGKHSNRVTGSKYKSASEQAAPASQAAPAPQPATAPQATTPPPAPSANGPAPWRPEV